ncbi:MAG: hypothetical protein FJW40_15820 [Acidobacteria bacterium]|nr:hypothetical protein [Acidobacteriota bacterium]
MTPALVLADDLTGAAEIGGVAWRLGHPSEVHTGAARPEPGVLVVADANTRILNAPEAARRMAELAAGLRGVPLFHKVDSALRGNIAAECAAIAEAAGLRRVLLVPANPSLGRTLCDGIYRIRGVPIHETAFAADPLHPNPSSHVLELLGAQSIAPGQPLPDCGLVIGEASTQADIEHWAQAITPDTLPAGAADFFRAVLGGQPRPAPPRELALPLLMVLGSASPESRRQIAALAHRGAPVMEIPRQGREQLARALKQSGRAILTLPAQVHPEEAASLTNALAREVRWAVRELQLAELWVEGGATAQAIVEALAWNRFKTATELAPGVVRLMPDESGVQVVFKPGSYAWPEWLAEEGV